MSDAGKTGKLWGRGIASVLLCRAAFVAAAAGPVPPPTLFYPSGTTQHDIELWLATLSEHDRKRAFRPIADAVLTDADRSTLRFEDIRDEIMFVRTFDSLGQQFVTGTKPPIAEALRENTVVAAQVRSMLLSLWGHRYLIDHGYLDRRETTSLHSAFLVPALARARGGLASSPSQGSIYVLSHLLEAGAISVRAQGRFKISRAAADFAIARVATEFISLMAKGDATSVESLLRRYVYVVVTPAIRDVLERLGPEPPLQRLVYRTADRLSPMTH
jgi:hypothetical protein